MAAFALKAPLANARQQRDLGQAIVTRLADVHRHSSTVLGTVLCVQEHPDVS